MALKLVLNGEACTPPGLEEGATLIQLVESLGFRVDRVAIELNGAIAWRRTWGSVVLDTGDRLEVVHFVGGGAKDVGCDNLT